MFLTVLGSGEGMAEPSDIQARLDAAHEQAKTRAQKLVSDLKSIEAGAVELEADMEELQGLKVTEKSHIGKVRQALQLLSNSLKGHHSDIVKAIAILNFIKSKAGDKDVSKEVLRKFQAEIKKEKKVDPAALRSGVEQACDNLHKVLSAEFRKVSDVQGDISGLQRMVAQALADVEEL